MRRLLLATGILLSSCSRQLDADPRLLTGTLVVDQEFSLEQRASILAAVELWRQATGERFAPQVSIDDVSCDQPFALKAVHADGCHVGHEVGQDGSHDGDGETGAQRVLGAAHPQQHWISVVTWLEGDAFRNNVAHELGHYLLIGHGDGIMAQARLHEPAVVAPTSLSEFCAIWSCVPDGESATRSGSK